MTVSRSQTELMHQPKMEIYPSVGEENHHTAFMHPAQSCGLRLQLSYNLLILTIACHKADPHTFSDIPIL
jgi:hypothetical protein